MTIERPGDVCAPKTRGMVEARERAAIAGKLGNRRDGLRWRPMSYEILVDNRRRDSGAPVLLKTRVYRSEVVTEWRRHESGYAYHVFEVGRDETEQTFGVEQVVNALLYHAELEGAIKRREFDRRAAARALRFWQPGEVK